MTSLTDHALNFSKKAGQKFISATLEERKEIADGLGALVFEPSVPLHWQPGQYATLGIQSGGQLIERPYSICSSPHEGFIELFLELVSHGAFTPPMWKLRVGDQATIEVGRAEDVLRKYLDTMAMTPDEITAYLCGRPGMIEAGRGILQRVGIPMDHVREEQYFPSPALNKTHHR